MDQKGKEKSENIPVLQRLGVFDVLPGENQMDQMIGQGPGFGEKGVFRVKGETLHR